MFAWLQFWGQANYFEFIPETSTSTWSTELEDGYLVSSLNVYPNPAAQYLSFALIDKVDGQLIEEYIVTGDTLWALSHYETPHRLTSIQGSDLQFIGVGALRVTEDLETLYSYTYKIDLQENSFELLDWEQFDRFTALYCIQPYQDGYIAMGERMDFSPTQLSLHLIDAEGDFVDFYNYPAPVDANIGIHQPVDLMIKSDTIYALVIYKDVPFGFQTEREFTGLHCIAPDGEMLWTQWIGDRDNYWVNGGGILLREDDILVSYTHNRVFDEDDQHSSNHPQSRPLFQRYSYEGELLETVSMEDYMEPGNYEIYQTQDMANGDILISGKNGSGAMIARFTDELEHLWDNRIDRYLPIVSPSRSEVHHTLPTSDGGYLCVGDYDYSPGGPIHPEGLYTGFALKLDSSGCWEEQCPSFSVGLGEQHFGPFPSGSGLRDLRVWPNPVTLDASTPLRVRVLSNARIERVEMVDMMGRISDLEFMISYSGSGNQELEIRNQELPAGLYSIRVVTSDTEVFSGKVVVE
jgi:hypothetical protein